MSADYYTYKTNCHLHNLYATLGDTTKLPIEGIGTIIYTLNGKQYLLVTPFTSQHYMVLYTPYVSTVNNQDVELTPPESMSPTCSSLNFFSK